MTMDAQLTPMMAQYRRIKGSLPPDALLLFRLGDFYEMFFEDATTGAQLLNVALTRRGGSPMCGIPYHAAPTYIGRLLQAGRKVAICDQMEEARPGRIVQRKVTQILTPGTHFDERMLVAERNNFLGGVTRVGKLYGLAFLDLTTSDFQSTEVEGEASLISELERLRPAEIVFPGEQEGLRALLSGSGAIVNGYEDWAFAPETAQFSLRDHFKVTTLDAFGLKGHPAALGASGALVHYLTQHLRRDVSHLTRLAFYQPADFLILDATTLRNLEILEPLNRETPKSASLYGALNRTTTPMGARRLREWLTQPLASVRRIRQRQEGVQAWLDEPAALEQFRRMLSEVCDLERTINRLSMGSGNARDLLSLRRALEKVPALQEQVLEVARLQRRRKEASVLHGASGEAVFGSAKEEVSGAQDGLAGLAEQLVPLHELADLIRRAIVEDPPLSLKEGGLIHEAFDPQLDELRRASREGKEWIAQLQQREVDRTGIPSLKIRFNSVFGYYIEVTKTHLDKVPSDYVRKQTIATGERYFTPDLKSMESKILGAEERSTKLEYELFQQLREKTLAYLQSIQKTAAALATLDVLAAFAEAARLYDYCRPEVGEEGVLRIREGRHPVLDLELAEERFIPNDTTLDLANQQIALITGPNMAGKSTYIRQVALLALLAHTGSFIPATEARIDLLDRVFTRIGASDNLARGQSTFMVEMSETANILIHASPNSLVILDEIGRGTSTFDGLSLAWSIVEHLHHRIGAKALFATHYHELTELAGRLPRVKNFNVAVREWHDQIVFLRQIVPGATDKSYGIQVARLAGVPRPVLDRAKEILNNLEASGLAPEGKGRRSNRRAADRDQLAQLPPPPQLDLFAPV